MNALAEFYRPPDWVTGHVSLDDAAFLDQVTRAVAPREVVEIGVASGCSSAVLLRALAASGGGRTLHSYDLMDRCYFDATRAVGAAVFEMAPEPAEGWVLSTGATAADAGQRLAGRGVPLAFIDADHRHPWPTLDLWALLPALAADAWVILHDVALARISEWQVYGPEYLFESWPGDTKVPPGQHNIGAIRLPGDVALAREWLVPSLRRPWQAEVDARLLDRLAIPLSLRPALSVGALPSGLVQRLASARASGRQVFIWGAGSAGRACLAALIDQGFRPDHVVDRDPAKHGRVIEGLPIGPVGALATGRPRPYVVVASSFFAEIEPELAAWGFEPVTDYAWVEPSGLATGEAPGGR